MQTGFTPAHPPLRLRVLSLLFCCAQAAAGDNHVPPRVLHDQPRGVIWALRDGLIMRYDARTRALLDTFNLPEWSYAIPSASCEPDLAVDENGNLFVTSNVDSPLWRIDAVTRRIERIELALDSDTDKDVGFTGLVPAAPGVLLAVSSVHGSLWKIDLAARTARKLPLDRVLRGACALGLEAGPQAPATLILCAPSRYATYGIRIKDMRQAEFQPGACTQGTAFHERPLR